jgi:hypothetical protein
MVSMNDLKLYHGATSRTVEKVKESGVVRGWWSSTFDLACQYAWSHMRQDHDKGFKRSRPVIIEAVIPKRRMKVHLRIAYYPRNQRMVVPRKFVKAAWRYRRTKQMHIPCLKRLWRRGRL